ncbi:MAG: DNA repair protein RecN [Agarilytica sp.]
MLTHLRIKDFTLVEQLDIELHEGLTVITGETGAGKSMMLDALGLTLGERTDANKIRNGATRAEVHASFDISRLTFAQRWLKDNDLAEEDECILRRVVTKEGRSRAYINGQTVTLQQLKNLGEKLIDIHSQHEHQSLLSNNTHRRLLDEFAKAQNLATAVKDAHQHWQELETKLAAVTSETTELNARFQLLRYQVDELDQLDLQDGDVEKLEQEQALLSNVEELQGSCQNVIDICTGDGVGLKDRIGHAIRLLEDIKEKPEALKGVIQLLQNAAINIDEAQDDVERFVDSCDQDPERLHFIHERLDRIYDISRKHQVSPEALAQHHGSLAEELGAMVSGDGLVETLQEALDKAREDYEAYAASLTKHREKAAKKLAKSVNQKLQQLAMERSQFVINLCPLENPSRHGSERIEFLISTNPGQAPQALQKVASGGELSRISLAIQVVTAETSTIPTLVFDEVDVGIGGTTGDVVGLMLSELGTKGQIFCVTHLAQVASKAHHHLRAEKQLSKKGASSSLNTVDGDEKIIEISRMMGGMIESRQALAHAKQMLETAS